MLKLNITLSENSNFIVELEKPSKGSTFAIIIFNRVALICVNMNESDSNVEVILDSQYCPKILAVESTSCDVPGDKMVCLLFAFIMKSFCFDIHLYTFVNLFTFLMKQVTPELRKAMSVIESESVVGVSQVI